MLGTNGTNPMELPVNFAAQGYGVIRELGKNPAGGRVTYLAQTSQGEHVVIKQFRFTRGATWEGFRTFEREVQTLKDLDHPGIPRYLDDFETADGFCLVQEYKQARMLSEVRNLPLDATKRIAAGLLEILIYLQDCTPPVIHRDIKPENVLVDDNFNVYLIDFGFARIGNGSIALSSVNAGTFGFMAPEQIRNLKLTNASDLYSLGLTLICAIARIPSNDIGTYIDWNNQLDHNKINSKLKNCSQHLIIWLQKITTPNPAERFANARDALAALRAITMQRFAKVKFVPSAIELEAPEWGCVIKKSLTICNTTPGTTLEGYWEVAPHSNDPPHTPNEHAWISFSEGKGSGDEVTYQVSVDTRKLTPTSSGNRELIFHCNHGMSQFTLPLCVTTGCNPESFKLPPWVYVVETFFILTASLLASQGYREPDFFILFLVTGFVLALGKFAEHATSPIINEIEIVYPKFTWIAPILLFATLLTNFVYRFFFLFRFQISELTLIDFLWRHFYFASVSSLFYLSWGWLALGSRVRMMNLRTPGQQLKIHRVFFIRIFLSSLAFEALFSAFSGVTICKRQLCYHYFNSLLDLFNNQPQGIILFLSLVTSALSYVVPVINHSRWVARYRKVKGQLIHP
ncbi:MAG: serine/threonine protein kinase [Oscillatoriales cyanobacterium SM2_2_1]|nr:serine/threonine protein kinase [Oscillatoriales cyanobacterium SM2_2_1]